MTKAADTIDRLTAEVERLTRDWETARNAYDAECAENERLRAALVKIATGTTEAPIVARASLSEQCSQQTTDVTT
jgi:hypothetical protein